MIQFNYNDGGRKAAGYKGITGDCVCRSIAIATGKPYQEIYDRLAQGNKTQRKSKNSKANKHGKKTASHGISVTREWFKKLMSELGFEWVACMGIGSGCKVHLRADELPSGRLVVSVSKHYTSVIDGVIHDTYDCSRGGRRCVYGYWRLKEGGEK